MATTIRVNAPAVASFALLQGDGYTRVPGAAGAVVAELRRISDGASVPASEAVTISESSQAGEYFALFTPSQAGVYHLTIRHEATGTHLAFDFTAESASGHTLIPVDRGDVAPGARVSFAVRWLHSDGTPFQPSQISRVVIEDANTGTTLFDLTGASIEIVDGIYVVTTPVAIGEPMALRDRWFYKARPGDPLDERSFTRVVASQAGAGDLLLSVEALKESDLLGVKLTLDNGDPYPTAFFETAIRQATAEMAAALDIALSPVSFTADEPEHHDYNQADYQAWGWFQLDRRPLMEVAAVTFNFTGIDGQIPFPKEWIQITNKKWGRFNLVPRQGTFSQWLITGAFPHMPLVNGRFNHWPAAFRVEYTAGFAPGSVPEDILMAISKKAASRVLNIAGDLIAGAGIASKSTSIGGLSQSVGTTSSATNAGYGSRIRQFERELKELIPYIRRQYHYAPGFMVLGG